MRAFCVAALLICVLSTVQAAGKIELVGPVTVDFGRYPASEEKTATFKITNKGDATLTIKRVRTTCACARVATTVRELAPGESGNATFRILADSIFEAYKKSAYVDSDDPQKRFLQLTVKGDPIPLVKIGQEHPAIGAIDIGKGWKGSLTLTPTQTGVVLGEPAVRSNYEAKAWLSTQETNGACRLNIELAETTKPGDLVCAIEIPVLKPEEQAPVKVSLHGRVGGMLAALPATLTIPPSKQPVTQHVRLRQLGSSKAALDPKSLRMDAVKGISFTATTDRNRRWLLVALTFSAESIQELGVKKKIELHFTVPGASAAKIICKPKS